MPFAPALGTNANDPEANNPGGEVDMKVLWSTIYRMAGALALALVLLYSGAATLTGSPALDNGAAAQAQGQVPGRALGGASDADLWRQARQGVQGTVSLPDKKYGVLVQSEGENWRAVRNGPVSLYGAWLMAAVFVLLAVFFAIRGRIRIEAGPSDRSIERFNGVERFAHWLTAISFIVLALTGLNLLFGRYTLKPLLGPEAFSAITLGGKYLHNFLAFAFMIGIVMMLVLWIRHNIPNRHDLVWLAKGGGMIVKGVHVPAKKFNAGQKIIFWIVVLGGISISWSGLSLMFPYQINAFAGTFALLNVFGFDLPTELAPLQEMQLTQLWHAIVGLIFIAFIIAHIYIGTLGMEGAFDAMGTGLVDENWAREHHDLWVAELKAESGSGDGGGAGEAPRPGE